MLFDRIMYLLWDARERYEILRSSGNYQLKLGEFDNSWNRHHCSWRPLPQSLQLQINSFWPKPYYDASINNNLPFPGTSSLRPE